MFFSHNFYKSNLSFVIILLILLSLSCSKSNPTNPGTVQTGPSEWIWQNPLPQGHHLRDVSFIDANIGIAVGTGGTILRTTDGGATWVSQSSGTTIALMGVSFFGANNGVAVGLTGTSLTNYRWWSNLGESIKWHN